MRIIFKGVVYESVETPEVVDQMAGNVEDSDGSLDTKTLNYVYDKMRSSIKALSDVEHTLVDGNQKKAVASLMKKTRETFNDKIKGVDYHPKSTEELKRVSDAAGKQADDALQISGESSKSHSVKSENSKTI